MTRIISSHNAVRYIHSIPSGRIISLNVKDLLESTADYICILFSNKCINIVIPIKDQSLTVDVKLLCIVPIGVNCKFNGIADSVILLVCYDCAVCKFRNCESNCFFSGNKDLITALVSALNGSGYIAVICFGFVTKSIDNSLFYSGYTANSTLLAVSHTGFGTSSRCACNSFFGVTERCDLLSFREILVTNVTVNEVRLTGLCASRRLSEDLYRVVAESLTIGCATQRAGLGSSTGCVCPSMLTGCLGGL